MTVDKSTIFGDSKKNYSQPKLCFHILQGRDLAAKDLNGLSDPYITININNIKAKSKCIDKTLNPEWFETLELEPDFKSVPTVAKLTCWDKDTLGKDFMGMVNLPLISFFDDSGKPRLFDTCLEESQWYDLLPRKPSDVVSGQIRIGFGFRVTHENHYIILRDYYEALALNCTIKNLQFQNNEQTIDSKVTQLHGLLFLDIISASDLPWDKDSTDNSLDMDPFVEATLGRTTVKTSIVKHDLNTVWKERIVFPINPDSHKLSVKLSLYYFDKILHNDHIGYASIPMKNIVAASVQSPQIDDDNKIFSLPLTLVSPFDKGDYSSQIVIRAEFLPYEQVRRNFWNTLTTSYDADDNGNMNKTEIMTMLESMTEGQVEELTDSFFYKYSKRPTQDELTFSELSDCLEELTSGPGNNFDNVFNIVFCPICQKKIASIKDNLDTVSHIAVCASKDPAKIDRIVMGNFISEAHAQRKWFTRIASFMKYGHYKACQNNINILVKNRATGEIFEEKVPTYIKLGIRLLYSSSKSIAENSRVKKVLRTMTIKQGKKFTQPDSAKEIESFIEFHKMNREEILEPLNSFKNFNEFFYRKLKPGYRKLASLDPRVAVSPADSRVMVFPTIDNAKELWIKGEKFSVSGLFNHYLTPNSLKEFESGSLCIFRLASQDYHRFHIPVDGIISQPIHVDGEYYTVNPLAVRSHVDVYGMNKRSFSFVRSTHHGTVAVICIGAMMVGSIVLTSKPVSKVKRLDEHGYFAFGGSTILVLFPRGAIKFDKDLIVNSSQQLETLLQVGDSIGTAA